MHMQGVVWVFEFINGVVMGVRLLIPAPSSHSREGLLLKRRLWPSPGRHVA